MIEINNKKDCCGCCGCINICYHNAISMEYDSEGFLYPIIDLDSCKDCRLCEKVCPQLNTDSFNTFNKAYVAINKNLSERCDSSSGGIFLPLARYTLENNGYSLSSLPDDGWTSQVQVNQSVFEEGNHFTIGTSQNSYNWDGAIDLENTVLKQKAGVNYQIFWKPLGE